MMQRVSTIETMAPTEIGRAKELPPRNNGVVDGDVFDAVLYPNRSLPNTGFMAVMTVVITANFFFGLYFFSIGAWPVIGFCGLDVLLVYVAFKVSYRQGRLREWVRVTPEALTVSRVLPSGHESRWVLQPFWTRVSIDRPVRHESQIRVTSRGQTLILGAFLSPEERLRFADALKAALERAKG